jgi:hypothetical protein
VIGCYLDESGTDEQSPTAVLGGLTLQMDRFFWLDVEWEQTLARHGVDPPLHMKEFVPHGRFGFMRHDAKRSLLSDLVEIINEHKTHTIAATLTAEQYRRHFSQLFSPKEASIYGFCFLLLAVAQGKYAQAGNYKDEIPFLIDGGNTYRRHIEEMHSFIRNYFQPKHFMNAGGLAFDADQRVRPLQAADLVAWTVRRRISGKFDNGFEPLPELFNDRHIEQPYEETWMSEIADALRARIAERRAGGEAPIDIFD